MTSATLFHLRRWRVLLAPTLAACLFLLCPASAAGQDSADVAPLSQRELDQVLAPIALYPDELLSQILMAATYPLEIVEAARFVEANPRLDGEALTQALELKNWDPSVSSLVNFPDVLKSLSDELNWTRKIGDAFLDDEGLVLDTVQQLRSKAKAEGNLSSNDKLRVSTESADAAYGAQTITIESPSPQYVYVPVYDPTVVYGNWWWPSYPPRSYYRPSFYRRGIGLTFGTGFGRGFAWGYAWGSCNWRQRSLGFDINRNARFNPYINRNHYRTFFNFGAGSKARTWRHEPRHRRGVSYRSRRTASRFDGRSRRDLSQARRSYRGYAPPQSSRQTPRSRTQPRVSTGSRPGVTRGTSGRSTTTTRGRTTGRTPSRTSGGTTGRTPSRTSGRTTGRTPSRTTTRSRTPSRTQTRTSPFTRGRTSQPTSRSATRGRSSRSVQKRTTTTSRRNGK